MQIGIFWGLILIVSLILNVFLVIVVRRALSRVDEYDEFFNTVQDKIKLTIKMMKSIDLRGSFESDDEVGSVFVQMKAMVDSLDVFLVTETNDEQE